MLKCICQSLLALCMLFAPPLAAIAGTPATYQEAYKFEGAPRSPDAPDGQLSIFGEWAQIDYNGGPYLADIAPLFLEQCGISAELSVTDFYTEVAARNGHFDPNMIPAGLLWVPAPESKCESILAALERNAAAETMAADPEAMAAQVLEVEELAATAVTDAAEAGGVAKNAQNRARVAWKANAELKGALTAVATEATAAKAEAATARAEIAALTQELATLKGQMAELQNSDTEQNTWLGTLQGLADDILARLGVVEGTLNPEVAEQQ